MGRTLSELIQMARARIREISADELQKVMQDAESPLLVDVREPYEYEEAHIPGSVLIPRGLLEGAADPNNRHRIEALHTARDRPVVVLCNTGGRAAMAADTLQQMGFTRVLSLAGGLRLWEAEDYAMEKGPYRGKLP